MRVFTNSRCAHKAAEHGVGPDAGSGLRKSSCAQVGALQLTTSGINSHILVCVLHLAGENFRVGASAANDGIGGEWHGHIQETALFPVHHRIHHVVPLYHVLKRSPVRVVPFPPVRIILRQDHPFGMGPAQISCDGPVWHVVCT